MTDKEIISKVFKKVSKNLELLDFDSDNSHEELLIYKYIFSHEFAKAFWGEEELSIVGKEYSTDLNCKYQFDDPYCDNEIIIPAWKYYLTIMVLEEEPLKYLEKFL